MDLAGLIARYTKADGVHPTIVPRMDLVRLSHPTEPVHALHQPALCIVAQGVKRVSLGGRIFDNGADRLLIIPVDVPVTGQVVEATPQRPYLCLRLGLDPELLAAMLLEAQFDDARDDDVKSSLSLEPTTPELLDAAARLVALLGSPRDISVLAPLAEREILYRLLLGGQAASLRRIARADSKLSQVNRAILWIKRNYDKSLRVDEIARRAHMSSSAFHQHFRAITTMTPLQYQKQIRLHEARRLIFTQAMDAAMAGHEVGYESPSQFSREYKRLFGVPPMQDLSMSRVERVAQAVS